MHIKNVLVRTILYNLLHTYSSCLRIYLFIYLAGEPEGKTKLDNRDFDYVIITNILIVPDIFYAFLRFTFHEQTNKINK